MKRIPRALIIPAVFAAVGFGAISPKVARADAPGQAVVEASQDFCVNPGVPCNDPAHLYNLGYEEVAAVNRSGNPYSTPDSVVLVCAKAYMGGDGEVHNLSGHVFAGFDPGSSISGVMRVFFGSNESSTLGIGLVNVTATDPVMGTVGTAVGRQATNNVTDLPIGGKIRVTISGTLEDQAFDPMTGFGPAVPVQGTITCNITNPYAIGPAPLGQAPDSESVISDTDGD